MRSLRRAGGRVRGRFVRTRSHSVVARRSGAERHAGHGPRAPAGRRGAPCEFGRGGRIGARTRVGRPESGRRCERIVRAAQSGQVHLALTATGADGTAEAVVTDAAGHAVGRFVAGAGGGGSLDLFLTAGAYTVTVRAVDGAARLDFRLGMEIVTDPIGLRPEDPTSAPASIAPPPRPNPPLAQPLQPLQPPTVQVQPALPAPLSGSVVAPLADPLPVPTQPIPQRTLMRPSVGGCCSYRVYLPHLRPGQGPHRSNRSSTCTGTEWGHIGRPTSTEGGSERGVAFELSASAFVPSFARASSLSWGGTQLLDVISPSCAV